MTGGLRGGSIRMSRIFNTRFEISLRVLIALNVSETALDLETVHVVDFVATYGKAFSISDTNLNGDNQFKFSEFAVRREIVRGALRELVLKGYAQPIVAGDGISYVPTEDGVRYFESLQTAYAMSYAVCAREAFAYVTECGLQPLIDEINRLSRRSSTEVRK